MLKKLLPLLITITDNCAENKMTVENLSVVFSYSFSAHVFVSMNLLEEANKLRELWKLLITNYKALFRD
jgi:hypothetical protein